MANRQLKARVRLQVRKRRWGADMPLEIEGTVSPMGKVGEN